jgi:hypothetical protein
MGRPYGSNEIFRPYVFPIVFRGGLLMGYNRLYTSDDNITIWVIRNGKGYRLALKRNGKATIFKRSPIKIRLENGSFIIDENSSGLKDQDSLDILPLGEKPFCVK